MKFGNIELKHGLFLAPLAGVSDNAMRQICKDFGAEYVTTEMISAKAVNFRDKKTFSLARIENCELPASIQLFGSEESSMRDAAKYLCDSGDSFKMSAIDINMGCPVPKIVGGGDGSGLMREPRLAGRIMSAVVGAANVPVTVKIRSGWNENEKNAAEIAKIAEDSGIAAVFIHGRTREQMYSPPADLDTIGEVKSAVSIPVVGNGDIYSADDAEKMIAYTGCDGVMIARGAFGNPWIFAEITARFEGKNYTPPSPEEKFDVIKRHLDAMIYYKGGKIAVMEARKHLAWYIKGCKGSAAARNRINTTVEYGEMLDIVREAMI